MAARLFACLMVITFAVTPFCWKKKTTPNFWAMPAAKLPMSLDEVRTLTGKPYTTLLTLRADEMEWADIEQFFNDEIASSAIKSPLERLYRDMLNPQSGVQLYFKQRFASLHMPLRYSTDMFLLREGLKRYEAHIDDKSHGWMSSSPRNVVFFFQIFALSGGSRAWKARVNSQCTSRPCKKAHVLDDDVLRRESHCVYLITNVREKNAAGKSMKYVGRTCNLPRRMRQHDSSASRCSRLRVAVEQYGIANMDVRVPVVGDEQAAKRSETNYIALYDCIYPRGYNLRCGDTACCDDAFTITTTDDAINAEHLDIEMFFEFTKLAFDDVVRSINTKEAEALM